LTGICITNEKLYLDERIQKIVLDNFEGISFAGFQEGFGFYSKHKDKLRKSLSLNGSVMDENLRCYIDEPLSNTTVDNKNFSDIMRKFPNAIIGELEKNALSYLAKTYPQSSLTYTAYHDLWFKICGIRIPKWWTDQRPFWDWMKRFGNRFNLCWIHLTMNKNKQELIDYAGSRETWLYVPYETTADELIKYLSNT
jgi:hypothetical protein